MVVANRRLYWWSRVVSLVSVMVLAVGVLYLGPLPSAHATTCGYQQVYGSSWAGGQGVDSHSNGQYEGDAYNSCADNTKEIFNLNLPVNPPPPPYPQYGWGWQCVELAQRMYKTRTWVSGVFNSVAYAAQIYSNASSNGWTTMQQTHIVLANIVPGDMLVTHEGVDGHVMLVDSVDLANNKIYAVDQNGSDGGRTTVTFSSGSLSDGNFQFSGVVHSPNDHLTGGGSGSSSSTPVAVSRSSSDMATFYDDGSGGLVSWSWSSVSGWSSYTWHDTFGTDYIAGQPTIVARDANDMDVFYRTGAGRLIHRGWNATNGWTGPDTELSSGVAGDPVVIARTSGDLQVFFRTSASEIKTISWNYVTGWNTNPVNLYSSNAAGDPGAVARTSSSMDVFFQKSNGDPVHLGWTSTGGWNNSEQVVSIAMAGKPGVISRSGGGDMSADYREANGNLAEWWWNSASGWGWTDWSASLAGPPSVTPNLPTTINSFYRETGGNINDHNFNGSGWSTSTVVGANGATGDPYALVRGGSNLEAFYWNGTKLMDVHWDAVNGWSTAQVN